MRKRVVWDDRLFKMLYQLGAKLGDCGKFAGNTDGKRAYERARKLGLPKRQQSSADIPGSTCEFLYVDHGKTTAEIADLLGTNPSMVKRILLSRGVKLRRYPQRILDDPRTAECVRLYRTGKFDYKQIAKKLGFDYVDSVGLRIRAVLGPQPQGGKRTHRSPRLHAAQQRLVSARLSLPPALRRAGPESI